MDEKFYVILREIRDLIKTGNKLQKENMTLREACDYMGVSDSYLYKLTSAGKIPHYSPTGKKIYFKRSELDEWLFTNKVETDQEVEENIIKKLKK